jgi:hypothetical protein
MPQLSLHHKNRVIQKTWNGMGKSSVSSLVRMSTGILAIVRRISCENTCTWVGPLSAHGYWCLGWSARGPWVLHREG